MKVIPIANNHISIELDNGETLDVNDGTFIPGSKDNSGGHVTIKISALTELVTNYSRFKVSLTTNDALRIEF
jgi:hypothetical protein